MTIADRSTTREMWRSAVVPMIYLTHAQLDIARTLCDLADSAGVYNDGYAYLSERSGRSRGEVIRALRLLDDADSLNGTTTGGRECGIIPALPTIPLCIPEGRHEPMTSDTKGALRL